MQKGYPKNFWITYLSPTLQQNNKKQGTGIGLYMAKTIVEEGLKGKLLVKNKKDGASFKIIFPIGEINE